MNRSKTIIALLASVMLATLSALAQESTTGSIKGRIRVESRETAAGVSVVVRQGEREVTQVLTDRKGEFIVRGLAPGAYGLTFRKTGLSVGTLENVQVKAGKTKELPDRLILTPNEASIARLSGSVFNAGGYSVPGIRIELARLEAGGVAKKIDGRITNESGQFVFRLSPDKATYRITARPEGAEALTKDVEIDGAMVYRVAFTLQRTPN
jgi:hypothetical protein